MKNIPLVALAIGLVATSMLLFGGEIPVQAQTTSTSSDTGSQTTTNTGTTTDTGATTTATTTATSTQTTSPSSAAATTVPTTTTATTTGTPATTTLPEPVTPTTTTPTTPAAPSTPPPSISLNYPSVGTTPAPMVLDISSNGTVLIRGTVRSVTGDTITIDSWGGIWFIRTSGASFASNAAISDITEGDFVGISGSIAQDQILTIDATFVRNWTSNPVAL